MRHSRCPKCGYYGFDGYECFDCGYQARERFYRLPLPVTLAVSLLLCAAVGFGIGVISMAGGVSEALAVSAEFWGF